MKITPADIQSVETENKKLFGNELSPDHPLQQWSAEHGLPLTLRASDTVSMLLCAGLMLYVLDHNWPVFLAIGGMSGRLITGVLIDFVSWHTAMLVIGSLAL